MDYSNLEMEGKGTNMGGPRLPVTVIYYDIKVKVGTECTPEDSPVAAHGLQLMLHHPPAPSAPAVHRLPKGLPSSTEPEALVRWLVLGQLQFAAQSC